MGANFSPDFNGYSDLKPFKFWCQKIMPAIYDESLSYYELLCKLVKQINNVIENMEAVEANTDALMVAYNQLQDYVNNYFDSLDVKAEIELALDRMARSGELSELLAPLVDASLGGVVAEQINDVVASQIGQTVLDVLPEAIGELSETLISDTVKDWLDDNVDPVGSAVIVDDSLTISGAAADSAVTGEKIDRIDRTANYPELVWNNGTITSSGVISNSDYQRYTNMIPCHAGDLIVNNTPNKDANNVYFMGYIVTYDANGFVERAGIFTDRTFEIDEGIVGFRFLFGRAPSSGVVFTNADLNYWSVKYYMQSATYQSVLEIEEHLNNLDNYVTDIQGELFAYTEFEETEGYWNADGTIQETTLTRSNMVRIIPNKKFYLGTMANQEIIGAFFDRNGNWIAPMRASETSVYSYPVPSKGDGSFDFCDIYEYQPPQGAYFISINLRVPAQNIRQSVSSKPVMLRRNTGNIFVDKDPVLSNVGNKKLCVIGASTAMIDRMYTSALSQYLCGWEEYLMLWYGDCEIFGYSGGSIGAGFETYKSVYEGIVEDAVDLSGFDDFIILGTKNGLLVTGVGDWGSIDSAPNEHDSYMGGLRGIVDYIYSQNRKANIYLTTMQYDSKYFNSNYTQLIDDANAKTIDMGKKMGIPVIDLASESGFNKTTYFVSGNVEAGYTYDGTHFNQDGNYQIGKCIRKFILGF